MERTVGEKELNGREKRGHNEDSGEWWEIEQILWGW
jgi:hypothetical protein